MYNLRHSTATLVWYLIIYVMLVSCGQKPAKISLAERKAMDSIVSSSHNIDTLSMIQKRMEREGNMLGSIVAYRAMGKELRNDSRFDEALKVHSEGLKQAETLGDTLEIVQALNNIGTVYRRMGLLDMAQDYHYRAFAICKESADTSFTAKKNRVVSLNGLGNIYLTLGNYARADSALRLALAGERELNSALGQAINYANIGSIFSHREQLDSAWRYYRQSMGLNLQAGNTLGVALCHIYFGELHEKEHDYEKAISEYDKAYQQLQSSQDEWHAMNPLIALAGIYTQMGNDTKAQEYLDKALHAARTINSHEHLAEVYNLYYKLYKRKGNYSAALTAHEKAAAMEDSVVDMEKLNRIQNAGLLIERNIQARAMNEVNTNLKNEQSARFTNTIVFIIIMIILIGTLVVFYFVQRIHRRNHLALKSLAEMRESFFTNITHEFRTPLTVILGLSRDLPNKSPDELKQNADAIEQQGNNLLTLINQLLDISKIKSKMGNPDWRNGNITTYVSMLVDTYRNYACSKNIDLQLFVKEPVTMDFVPDYINKVFNNLLSNAFKFTPEHGKITVAMWHEDSNLLIEVSDTGEGMDKETANNVFNPFYQGVTDSMNIGTGIGLALVKQVIDSLNGKINVRSREGYGTTFHIEIPITNECNVKLNEQPMDNTPILPTEEKILTDTDAEDNQYKMLVIEDNRDIATYIGEVLSERYAVAYATNGEDGWQKAINLVPDLIITDLMMPGMDGLELCRRIRSNDVVNHIPIVIVTAKISNQERIKGFEAGADAYLAKPFNVDELRTVVERLLDRQRSLRSKFSNNATHTKEQQDEVQLTDTERRFLAKTVDHIYLLAQREYARRKDVHESTAVPSQDSYAHGQFASLVHSEYQDEACSPSARDRPKNEHRRYSLQLRL